MTHRAGADSGGTLCTSLATVRGRRDGDDADDVDDADRSRTALRFFAGGDFVRSRPRRCRDGVDDGDGNFRFAGGDCSRPRGATVDGDGAADDAADDEEDSDDGSAALGSDDESIVGAQGWSGDVPGTSCRCGGERVRFLIAAGSRVVV